MKNVVLIGFMGAGKSVVGKRLARELGFEFFDTDQFIEKKAGKTIAQIFEDGEASFRRLEADAVRVAVSRERRVVATGGGAVVDPENREQLGRYGTLVWLYARPELILRRTQRRPEARPLLKGEDSEGTIKRLMEERKPYYQQAAFSIDTSDLPVQEVVVAIKNKVLGIGADTRCC